MIQSELIVSDRNEITDKYVRRYRLLLPDAKVGPGEGPWVDARCLADQIMPLMANARLMAGRTTLEGMVGSQLDDFGATIRRPRAAASGASGFVTVSTGLAGCTIVRGDECYSQDTGLIYRALRTKTLSDGEKIDVQCVETGPTTNVDAGRSLAWSSPRPGCYASCVVFEKPDGTGISGGREIEGDDDYRKALGIALSNPAAAGNDTEVQRLAEDIDGSYVRQRYGSDSTGHAVPVAKAFTYPALLGPGTIGLCCVLKPETAVGSRRPSAEQMAAIYQHVTQFLPADHGVIQIFPVDEDFDLVMRVKWSSNGWRDAVAWPPYLAEGSQYVVTASTSATAFTIGCSDASYSGRTAPQVGNAFAVFDADDGVFRRKAVLSVTGAGPWAIVCDTAAEASDVSFRPLAGARVSPWSDSLDLVASSCVALVQQLGPGEAIDFDPGDGRRGLRSPANAPTMWPNGITAHWQSAIASIPQVARFSFETGEDAAATPGDAAAVNILRLADLGVYPL